MTIEAATQPEQLSALSVGSATSALPTSSDNNTTIERFVSVPPLLLDRKKRLVTIQGNFSTSDVELTKGETAVLTSLMKHPGKIPIPLQFA